ncbi:flhB HrpN YscU SpaS family protein [Vibrio paracholerae]|nr:flhB HrpN YscU SpaS family protein [Vibrio paracholerae]
MAESDGQERTEEATPRRLQQAKEKGQVARSKELASVSVLVVGAVSLMWFGEILAKGLMVAMQRLFELSREEIFDLGKLFDIIAGSLVNLLLPLLMILTTLFIAALIGAAGLVGSIFPLKLQCPNYQK